MSALVEFFTSDPGDQVLEDATKINIIESIASIRRLVGGSGTVIMFGDVVNDRGQPEVPVVLENGLADLARLYGGFQHWMGLSLDTVGATTGYNGNLFAQTKGLSAPKIVLVPINAEVRNAGGTALTAEFTRGLGTGDFVMPAGTRFYAAPGGYELATLEDVTWAGAGGAQSVRFRQVSGEGEPAVDISTVTTLNPADVTWDNTVELITITTAAATPVLIDAAAVVTRYQDAFNVGTSTADAAEASIAMCDRTEAGILDNLSTHCNDAVGDGYFRVCAISPPIATTAAVARGTVGDGSDRTGLTQAVTAYVHPGWQRQFREDSANLTGPQFLATFPAAPSFAFLMANTVPEENPAHVHQILVDHKIVAVETLAAGVVDRKLHEQDAIVQPIMARSSGAMKPSFHTGVMANGTPTARRRMAYFLWANILDLVEPFHKRLAHQANRDKITSRISAFLSRLKALGRIESFLPPTAEWSSPQLTVTVVVNETPNADTITIRGTFGADVVQDAEG